MESQRTAKALIIHCCLCRKESTRLPSGKECQTALIADGWKQTGMGPACSTCYDKLFKPITQEEMQSD